MTEQEKKILLKYLCASLPYDTIVNVDNGKYREDMKLRPYHIAAFNNWDIKPYLRPLESMTEKEQMYFWCLNHNPNTGVNLMTHAPELIGWLISKHFDYRGLIPMELALPAPEGMYK